MSIVPYLPLNCELTAGTWLLRLLFIGLMIVSWLAYHRAYSQGWRQASLVLRHTCPWRLKPRTPEACEACQKGLCVQIFRPRTGVVPYEKTKSSCGRRKTLNTAGHACPNPACAYFAVTAAHLHAVVGNGKRGQRQDIQSWRCQACGKKFTSRLSTPLYRLKTDLEKVTLVLMLLAHGCDLSVLVRCTPHAEATVTRWLERMGRHSQRLHGCFFLESYFPLFQLDALNARAALAAVLKAQGLNTLIQTAFVERVNLTLWRGVARLMQRTWAYAQMTAHLQLHVEW